MIEPICSRRVRPGRRQRGLSIIEVLIAMALLLVIALGIIPLITRSMANNVRGWEATEVANYSKDQLEGFSEIAFDNPDVTIAAGTERLDELKWTDGNHDVMGDDNEGWWTTAVVGSKGVATWTRQTRIRQYSIAEMTVENGDGTYSIVTTSPLDASTDSSFVHLKEEVVTLRGARQAGALGAGQVLSVRMVKAF